jgi:hypothetical protein
MFRTIPTLYGQYLLSLEKILKLLFNISLSPLIDHTLMHMHRCLDYGKWPEAQHASNVLLLAGYSVPHSCTPFSEVDCSIWWQFLLSPWASCFAGIVVVCSIWYAFPFWLLFLTPHGSFFRALEHHDLLAFLFFVDRHSEHFTTTIMLYQCRQPSFLF